VLGSKALTKVQSIILIALVAVAAVGVAAYLLWDNPRQSSDTIKIGVCADLDKPWAQEDYEGVKLAVEQINAEGGLLGRQVEVFGEDDDGGLDPTITSTALNRLITVDNVDFIIGLGSLTKLEIIAQHKKIFISTLGVEECEQQVLDDYEKYKYYFACSPNSTSTRVRMINSLLNLRDVTGFNKIGLLSLDFESLRASFEVLESSLSQKGFEVVYKNFFPIGTFDFSSYFAAAEAAGVETLLPIMTDEYIPFVKEYYDRQSPILIFGGSLGALPRPSAWDYTDGKCEDVCSGSIGAAVGAGYPLTSKTLATIQAFIDKGFEAPLTALGYDIVRFILADAIKRAGTIETEAVIKALEETSVETSNAKKFTFTESHAVMVGSDPNDPEADYMLDMLFQWQNGELVPVYPKAIMEEAGATYTFPDWSGPWDDLD